MEGLNLLLAACMREDLPAIRRHFQTYIAGKRIEPKNAIHFNRLVDTTSFSSDSTLYDGHSVGYMIKVAFGTVDNWLPLVNRILATPGVLRGDYTDYFVKTLFDGHHTFETAEEVRDWVKLRFYANTRCQYIADTAFLCWRDEESSLEQNRAREADLILLGE
jgi:hypothetical protein